MHQLLINYTCTGMLQEHTEMQTLGLQGNEFSYYMLMASSFVMNHCERAGQWALFPYVLNTCNQRSDADQLRQVGPPLPMPPVVDRQELQPWVFGPCWSLTADACFSIPRLTRCCTARLRRCVLHFCTACLWCMEDGQTC